MRRIALTGMISVFLAVVIAGPAMAAPNLSGTWSGSARRVTNTESIIECTTDTITLVLAQCPLAVGSTGGNLLRGNLTVRSSAATGNVVLLDQLKVVGRWTSNNAISIHGTRGTGPTFRSTLLFGTFVPANRTITVSEFSWNATSTATVNREYDVFPISRPNSPF